MYRIIRKDRTDTDASDILWRTPAEAWEAVRFLHPPPAVKNQLGAWADSLPYDVEEYKEKKDND
jgi:hypothetical protein